jgi:hypothetical protein
MKTNNPPLHTAPRQSAADYLQAEDNNPRILIAEWGFKILFRFFSVVATLLGMLSFRK